MSVLFYGPDAVDNRDTARIDEITQLRNAWPVTWVNVDGVAHGPTLTTLQAQFGLHPLALEDVAHLDQRPKVDSYDENLFVVVRMVAPNAAGYTEQVSLFVGDGYVLSFQERPGDCLEPVRERIRSGRGRIRRQGADYLAYAIIDTVIDSYFPWIDQLNGKLEGIELQVFSTPSDPSTVATLQSIRAELREIRRANLPHRDVVAALLRKDNPRVTDFTRLYLTDCADHAARISEMVDSARDESTDLMQAYLSSVSNRMNEVMKVLTIVAAVFIPLSFIAGLYGMNFDTESTWNMPELGWRFGYLSVLGLMAAVAGGLLAFFKKKGWF